MYIARAGAWRRSADLPECVASQTRIRPAELRPVHCIEEFAPELHSNLLHRMEVFHKSYIQIIGVAEARIRQPARGIAKCVRSGKRESRGIKPAVDRAIRNT